MIAAVMITVKIAGTKNQCDMELPADTPMKELSPKFLMALKNIENDLFFNVGHIKIKSDDYDRYLTDEETFDSAGIWDGSIITVERMVQ